MKIMNRENKMFGLWLAVMFFLGVAYGSVMMFNYCIHVKFKDRYYCERRLRRINEICQAKRIENDNKIRKCVDINEEHRLAGENRAYFIIQSVINGRTSKSNGRVRTKGKVRKNSNTPKRRKHT